MTAYLDTVERVTGPAPQAAVIWLHGLGADGNDFVPIVPELDLPGCGDVRFVFPHAPTMPVTVNGGYVMRAWYDILGPDLVRREYEAGVRASLVRIEALIAREVARGITSDRIVLAGFSQGCAMTLLTGLRHREKLAGLIALSGYLPLAAHTSNERSDANRETPIFMAHGSQDAVIPLARATQSRDLMVSLGYNVEWHAYPMAHSLCADEVGDLSSFLKRILTAGR